MARFFHSGDVHGTVLILLISLGEIFAPQLVRVIAPGFDAVQKTRVISLTRLMLPAQFFLYLGSVMGAVQNAKTRFLIPALATVVYNIGIISGAGFSRRGSVSPGLQSVYWRARSSGSSYCRLWPFGEGEPDSLRISILITPASACSSSSPFQSCSRSLLSLPINGSSVGSARTWRRHPSLGLPIPRS